MAVTASNATFDVSEVRTGLKCSWVSSSTGFLTKTSDTETSHVLATAASTLTMIHPRPAAHLTFTSLWNKWVTNAPYKAYPSAVGGCFPYIWSLVNAPSGMTIASPTLTDNSTYNLRAAHGRITWASPTAGTHTFLVRCTDQLGNSVSESVTLNVADSNGIWVDTVSGTDSTGAAGTFASPFKTIANFYGGAGGTGVAGDRADSTYANKILFFKTAGTYTVPVDESTNNLNLGSNKPCTWVAYNDVAAVLDCSASGIRIASGNGAGTRDRLEFIGLTTKFEDTTQANTFQMFMTMVDDGGDGAPAATVALGGHVILADHTVDSYKNQGTSGADNCGGIVMFDVDGASSAGKRVRRVQFRNIQIKNLGGGSQPTTGTQVAALLPMATRLSEYNNVTLVSQDGACSSLLKLKHKHNDVVVRNCVLIASYAATTCVSSMGGGGTQGNNVQWEYNCFYMPTGGGNATLNHTSNQAAEGAYGATWFRRNTFMGDPPACRQIDETSGTNTIQRGANVLECATTWVDNADWTGRITQESLDRQASSGLVDASGLLEGSERTSYLGIKGWEIA